MFAKKWGAPVKEEDGHLWQYYIEKKFAFLPVYANGTLVWLGPYWMTWPVDETGNVVKMYRTLYSSDPGPG